LKQLFNTTEALDATIKLVYNKKKNPDQFQDDLRRLRIKVDTPIFRTLYGGPHSFFNYMEELLRDYKDIGDINDFVGRARRTGSTSTNDKS
jgi:hypothetical protein